MKKLTLFLAILLVFINIKAQNINTETKPVLSFDVLSIDDLKQLVFSSKKKLKVVYFFKTGCPYNVESMPTINTFYKEQISNLDLFVVSFGNKKNKQYLQDYLFFKGYQIPVYIIDDSAIFNNKKYKRVVENLCDSCNQKSMGYADFFILDENNNLIVQSNCSQNLDEHIQILKSQLD
ncbi:TlpA family protein disulfide reductase [Mesonia ostreae]|uniref:Thioredoxin domain-containing protein n=1 Tax=Mesonia ostreae TaxID=861110 RepID=A0ABU2KED3_9FLAO|nr:hypothetical protein [Mesonia ostreae]MDT0293066.1 hypothetical protein [Mesonia ostreae]